MKAVGGDTLEIGKRNLVTFVQSIKNKGGAVHECMKKCMQVYTNSYGYAYYSLMQLIKINQQNNCNMDCT